MNIPIYKPFLGEKESLNVNEALNSTWISSKGKFIDEFENSFSKFTKIKNCISVSNGTVALHLALLSLGIGKDDEVIVPTLTYIASVNCINYVGAKPIFVDSSENNWQASIEEIERKITKRTKAIICVHLYGFAAPIKEIKKIAKRNNLFLIEDCAEAIGTKINETHVGNFSDVATFSFYGNKTITTGEGGMVSTNNNFIAKKIYQLKTQGLAPDKEYWHDIVGYNYRMTNICAAIGHAQLEKVEYILQRKKFIFEYYSNSLNSRQITLQKESTIEDTSSYWMVCILINNSDKKETLRRLLTESGIETRPVFNPIHLMPIYNNSTNKLSIAEDISNRGINLPSFPQLTEKELDYICKKINNFIC